MFDYEREVRIILEKEEFEAALGHTIDWDPSIQINAVFIHPEADEAFFQTAVDMQEARGGPASANRHRRLRRQRGRLRPAGAPEYERSNGCAVESGNLGEPIGRNSHLGHTRASVRWVTACDLRHSAAKLMLLSHADTVRVQRAGGSPRVRRGY
jgi:hypothetical protein